MSLRLSAPVKGWTQRASGVDTQGTAEVMDGWVPTARGCRLRGGLRRVASVGAPVTALFGFDTPNLSPLFAATETDIRDISALDPDGAGTVVRSGLTSGAWCVATFGAGGGPRLIGVNGADTGFSYDGAAFADLALREEDDETVRGSDDLAYVWGYRNRLWFIVGGTFTALYLDPLSLGGKASPFVLEGVMKAGGALLFGATWSMDTGDGLDDKIVFVSTEGEVAVYAGAFPTDANGWALQGLYRIGRPLGPHAHMRAGGDLLIATVEGLVSLNEAISKDRAALSATAVSRPIEPHWTYMAGVHETGWTLTKWAERNLVVVTLPSEAGAAGAHLETGAWGRLDGWRGTCAAYHDGRLFTGRSDGRVVALDETGNDDGAPFTARLLTGFNDFGAGPGWKVAQLVKPLLYASAGLTYRVGIATDETVAFPVAPSPNVVDAEGTTWGTLVWGVSPWPVETEPYQGAIGEWEPVAGAGSTLAVSLQVGSAGTQRTLAEVIGFDLHLEGGAAVA